MMHNLKSTVLQISTALKQDMEKYETDNFKKQLFDQIQSQVSTAWNSKFKKKLFFLWKMCIIRLTVVALRDHQIGISRIYHHHAVIIIYLNVV